MAYIVLIAIAAVLAFTPCVIWLCRSIAIIHTNWRPSHTFNKVFHWSWLLLIVSLILIAIAIAVV